jgi:hypothetical protein
MGAILDDAFVPHLNGTGLAPARARPPAISFETPHCGPSRRSLAALKHGKRQPLDRPRGLAAAIIKLSTAGFPTSSHLPATGWRPRVLRAEDRPRLAPDSEDEGDE